jgi:hypothetical protein
VPELPRNAYRMPALLETARLIDHQHAASIAKPGNHLIAHQITQGIGIPTTSPKQ